MSKSRLGKGLDALLSDSVKTNAYADAYSHGDAGGDGPTATQLPSNGAGVLTIAIDTIVPSPYQPRQIFDEAAIQELAQSIKQETVAPSPESPFFRARGRSRSPGHRPRPDSGCSAAESKSRRRWKRRRGDRDSVMRGDC